MAEESASFLDASSRLVGMLALLGALLLVHGVRSNSDVVAVAVLMLLLGADVLKMTRRGPSGNLDPAACFAAFKLYVLDLLEAWLFGVLYAAVAVAFGFVPELFFPPADADASLSTLLWEVLGQCGLNVVLSIIVRDTVHDIVIPLATDLPQLGHKGDRTGTSVSGGIFMGTIIVARQPQWKEKIVLLEAALFKATARR
jgi:hypothetical protein